MTHSLTLPGPIRHTGARSTVWTNNNQTDKKDENGLLLYEGMLIKAEKDIRRHIRVNKIYI